MCIHNRNRVQTYVQHLHAGRFCIFHAADFRVCRNGRANTNRSNLYTGHRWKHYNRILSAVGHSYVMLFCGGHWFYRNRISTGHRHYEHNGFWETDCGRHGIDKCWPGKKETEYFTCTTSTTKCSAHASGDVRVSPSLLIYFYCISFDQNTGLKDTVCVWCLYPDRYIDRVAWVTFKVVFIHLSTSSFGSIVCFYAILMVICQFFHLIHSRFGWFFRPMVEARCILVAICWHRKF